MEPGAIADRLEIEDLLTAYATSLDAKDWDGVAAVFADDAVLDYTAFDGPRGGVEEVVAWIAESVGPFDVVRHHLTNHQITVAGDVARSRCYLLNPMGRRGDDGRMHFFTVGGDYRDRLVRTRDGWRISERVAGMSWFEGS